MTNATAFHCSPSCVISESVTVCFQTSHSRFLPGCLNDSHIFRHLPLTGMESRGRHWCEITAGPLSYPHSRQSAVIQNASTIISIVLTWNSMSSNWASLILMRAMPSGLYLSDPRCAYKRRARMPYNQSLYRFLIPPNPTRTQSYLTVPSQFNPHQWISSLRSSQFKVFPTLPRPSSLLALPFPLKPPSVMVVGTVIASSLRWF